MVTGYDPRTDAERDEDAMRYGLCTVCGEPRMTRTVFLGGHLAAIDGTCPNGHDG